MGFELFNTSYVRRLKRLSNFGAGSIVSDGISFGVRKIYNKTPMLDGKPLSEDLKVKNILEKLGELKREYELIVNDNY